MEREYEKLTVWKGTRPKYKLLAALHGMGFAEYMDHQADELLDKFNQDNQTVIEFAGEGTA